jgi:hypothetical protein
MSVGENVAQFQAQCRLCSWSGGVSESFAIANAPRSVNDLPMRGTNLRGATVRLSLWECLDCGLIQLGDQSVPLSWRAAVTATGISSEMRQRRLKQFQSLRSKCANDTILEIGSGDGSMLPILSEAGFSAQGLEWSDEMIAQGCNKGRQLRKGHVLDGILDGDKIQNFVCLNFLEHATRPKNMMSAIARACSTTSIGLIEVPDFGKNLAIDRSHDLVAEHLSYFTNRTLRLCLETSGFEIIETGKFWYDDDIYAVVKPRRPLSLKDWISRDPAIALIRQYLDRSRGSQAIWGASHQALTLLSMLDHADVSRICCIADSSVRKQGRADPAWGIPIVSPSAMLGMDPPQVLIMAAGYSDEVAGQLRSMGYGGKVHILANGLLQDVR